MESPWKRMRHPGEKAEDRFDRRRRDGEQRGEEGKQ